MTPRKKPPQVSAASIGARIREARETAQLTQGQVGDAIGVTYQMVYKYENGKGRLSAELLAKIAEVVKQEVSFFYS